MVDWNLRVRKLEKTLQIGDSHYLTKIKFTQFWDASTTFPLTEGLEYPEFKGLDHRGIRNQPALPTVSPHLPQDALNKAHWKFFPPAVHIRSRKSAAFEATRVESTQTKRERSEHTVWDKNGYKAELLKPFSWFRTHKNGSKIQGYHSQPEFPVPPNEFHHGRTIPSSPRVIGNGTKVPP